MDLIKCQHLDILAIPKEAKVKSFMSKQNFDQKTFKCQVCETFTPNAWLCLEENCLFSGCDQELKFHLFNHYEEAKKVNSVPHCIFFNPVSLRIFCFQCNCEVHDFNLLGADVANFLESENLLDPAKIRDILAIYLGYLKEGSLKYTEPVKNAKNYIDNHRGIGGLVNLGNTSHFNSVIQLLAQVPSLKYFYKTLYQKSEKSAILPEGTTKKFSYLLAELFFNIWSGVWRVIKPSEALFAFFDLHPNLRGYGHKDIHETYRYFLNAIHEEHRILIPRPFELGLKPVPHKEKLQDEWDIVQNLDRFLENSIITDTFQGKMYSHFQCHVCKEELSIEDYFTYLDLRIPTQKDPQKLKKWNLLGLFEQKRDIKDSESSFHIYEAFVEFFETKVFREPGNLYCEKCQEHTPYRKDYRFLNFPNVLCLHIKRKGLKPEDNIKVQLSVDDLDLSPFIKNNQHYQQDGAKYELIGYIENIDHDERPRYSTTFKHVKSNQWVTIRDHEITKVDEKSILENRAIMIFYKRKFDFVRIKEIKNLKSQIELLQSDEYVYDPAKLVYIPNHWFEKAISLSNPGMIHTWHLMCKHGLLKPSYRDCFFPKSSKNNLNHSMMDSSFIDKSFIMNLEDQEEAKNSNYTSVIIENQSIKLPKEIGEYFAERYGGGPLIQEVNVCQDCLEEAVNLKIRRRRERKLISMYDNIKTQINYAVSKDWIDLWKNFLYTNNRFLRKSFLKGYPPPGPVNNSSLMDKNGKINMTLIKNVDYRVVNAYIWKIFVELYGAEIEVKMNGKDLNSYLNPMTKIEVELRQEDLYLLKELRGLVQY